jgi:hypothetical protein
MRRPPRFRDDVIDLLPHAAARTTRVEAIAHAAGVREIFAAATQLALHAVKEHDIDQLLLVLWSPRITKPNLAAIWADLRKTLAPAIAKKLQLVVAWETDTLVDPDAPAAHALAAQLRSSVKLPEPSRPDLSFEVLRVLLLHWATDKQFVPIGELQTTTGLSYPSVARGLAALEDQLERSSSRSVRLRAFPEEQWTRLLALAPRVRQTHAFEDRSGRSTPHDLLARVQRLKLPRVAIGGVEAARHWHRALDLPAFDLDGLPRLDLTVHAPRAAEPELIRRLDPALVPARGGQAPILVVHALHRAEDAFDRSHEPPYTDVIETLLDLAEQRTLRKQYGDLLAHLRRRANR